MKFFNAKTKKLPRAAKKSLLPRKEFIARGRERFLATYDASALARDAHSAAAHRPAYVIAFFKIGIGALALLCIGVGLSAYADTANVSATSALYPLKRLGENVQLALTPASEQPELRATFAVRRANEIAALQVSAPTSTLIPQLTTDLDQDINNSLSVLATSTPDDDIVTVRATSSISSTIITTITTSTPATSSSPSAIGVYCSAFNVSTSGVLIGHLEANLALHPNGFTEFNEQCNSVNTSTSANAPTSTRAVRHGHHGMNTSTTPAQAPDDGAPAVASSSASTSVSTPTSTTSNSTTNARLYIPPVRL